MESNVEFDPQRQIHREDSVLSAKSIAVPLVHRRADRCRISDGNRVDMLIPWKAVKWECRCKTTLAGQRAADSIILESTSNSPDVRFVVLRGDGRSLL